MWGFIGYDRLSVFCCAPARPFYVVFETSHFVSHAAQVHGLPSPFPFFLPVDHENFCSRGPRRRGPDNHQYGSCKYSMFIFDHILIAPQPYSATFTGYLLSSKTCNSHFVPVPLDHGLATFITLDDLTTSMYVRTATDKLRVRSKDPLRLLFHVGNTLKSPDLNYQLGLFSQDQQYLRDVGRTPILQTLLPGVVFKGDLLVVKLSCDAREMLNVEAQDVDPIHRVITW